jgi:hypothetical protein
LSEPVIFEPFAGVAVISCAASFFRFPTLRRFEQDRGFGRPGSRAGAGGLRTRPCRDRPPTPAPAQPPGTIGNNSQAHGENPCNHWLSRGFARARRAVAVGWCWLLVVAGWRLAVGCWVLGHAREGFGIAACAGGFAGACEDAGDWVWGSEGGHACGGGGGGVDLDRTCVPY